MPALGSLPVYLSTMRLRFWTAVAISLCAASVLLSISCGDPGGGVARSVTTAGIRSVQLGMTQADVTIILGRPLAVKVDQARGVTTLEYSRPVRTSRSYPMLWIHLKDGRVREVYAKRYINWGLDDEGAYGLSDGGRWEGASFAKMFGE